MTVTTRRTDGGSGGGGNSDSHGTPPLRRQLPRMLLVAVLYFLAGQLSFSLSVSHGIVTMVVFMAEGVSLAAAILWGPRIWPGIFVGQFFLAASQGLGWPLAAGIACVNSLEAVIGVGLFRRLKLQPDLSRLRDIALLLSIIVAVLQPISATGGVLLLWNAGVIGFDEIDANWLSWWMGNSIGQLMVAPMLLATAALDMGRRIQRLRLLEVASLALFSCGLALLGPELSKMRFGLWLAEGMMIVIAIRHGLLGATFATMIQAVFMIQLSRAGMGPFSGHTGVSELNFFLLRLIFIGQFVALVFVERRQEERKMRLSHDQLTQAQQIANLGSWSLDLQTYRPEWSEELYRILELDPGKTRPSPGAYQSRVHPEDRGLITSTFQEALASGHPYECNHRLLFPDGRLKFVRARGNIRFASDGKPLVFIGTMLDLTQLHEAEERLHLYAHIFEQSNEAIVITSTENNIITVNPAFTRLTGYTLAEVAGRNPRTLASGKTPRETYESLWHSLKTQGHWCGELWDRRKDGSIYPKLATISVIRDTAGRHINYMASFVDISERKAEEKRIEQLAHHDTLTGLHNRFSLHLRLEQATLAARREGGKLAVLFFDMDRFKRVNDELGHHVGDLLLIEIAARLSANARVSDILARLGGDEFVMVLTGLGEHARETVDQIATKITERLAQPYELDGHQVISSSSIGIGLYPEHGEDIDTLMRHADMAMYHAKEAGCSLYRFYDPSMAAINTERQILEADLQHALDEEDFELHYQPQVKSGDHLPYRLEALARWRHSEHGWVAPGKFIPIIEKLGLSTTFAAWVIDESCRQVVRWRKANTGAARVAVNLTASQLRSPLLIDQTRSALLRHGIQPGEFEFEIEEDAILDDPEDIIDQMKALDALGVELAIANFGRMLSSLTYLRRLPVRTLKLSREIVAAIDRQDAGNSNIIVDTALTMAHDIGLRVVAEGVETEAQQNYLVQRQCDLLQGYLVSKPLTEAEVVAFMNGGGI